MSDVPLGIVLQWGSRFGHGGSHFSRSLEANGLPLPACWTVAESEDNPDWKAAEIVCQALDLEHHQHVLEGNAFNQSLPSLSWHGEDLDITVLFFQPLFSTMSQSVKVGLCGQGAMSCMQGILDTRTSQAIDFQSIQDLDACEHPFANRLREGKIVGNGWSGDHNPSTVFSNLNSTLDYEMNHGQLTNFQLRLVDRHSMAHGLEVRVPFLRQPHVSASSGLPLDWENYRLKWKEAALQLPQI